MTQSVRLRPMREDDLPAVQALEQASQPFPWPAWFFRRQLRRGASCWVLEEGRRLVGFGIVSLNAQCAHVMNMCICAGRRRRGLGRRLLLHLLNAARGRHCTRVRLEVRTGNRPAILLYRKLGFRRTAIRTAYYPARRGRQDALEMARSLRPRALQRG